MEKTRSPEDQQAKVPWLRGMIAATPIVLGYLPVGFAFGVLAQKAGLSTLNTLLMSLIVYAGSSQLIAVGLISTGIAPISLILTTFIVNLRHMLMSAAVSPHVNQWPKCALAGFAYELTDETFALHSTRFDKGLAEKVEVFAINITSHVAWIMGTGMGIAAGRLVVNIEPLGLDYVLPAMFIALLVMQIKKHTHIYAALLSGLLSVGLLILGFDQSHVIIATIIGALFGAWMAGWKSD
jgi:4-azaleucine resistance transporter AzlC